MDKEIESEVFSVELSQNERMYFVSNTKIKMTCYKEKEKVLLSTNPQWNSEFLSIILTYTLHKVIIK